MNSRWPKLASGLGKAIFQIASALVAFASITLVRADVALRQWAHNHWQTDSELPQNSIFCFAQDANGFLWLGTEDGLISYDGVHFKTLNQHTTPAIRYKFASSLLVTRDGSLWVGTRTGGLVRYNVEGLQEPSPALMQERVFALAEGDDQTVWAGTAKGLARISGSTIQTFGLNEGLPNEKVTALCVARDGAIWLGFAKGELAVLRHGVIIRVPHPEAIRTSAILAIVQESASGEIWIAHDGDGLFRVRDGVPRRIELLGNKVENQGRRI